MTAPILEFLVAIGPVNGILVGIAVSLSVIVGGACLGSLFEKDDK